MLVLLPFSAFAQDTLFLGSSSAMPSAQSSAQSAVPPSITKPSSRDPRLPVVQESTVVPVQYLVAPDTTKTSFQEFIETATGQELDVFGRDLFGTVPSTFAPLSTVQVNPDYMIGPGDVLQIRGWGMIAFDVSVPVSRSGAIHLPQVGRVQVSGVKSRDLEAHLKRAVGRIFTNFDLSATVAETRSVQVYVTGHALRPGTYTLSAMSSLLNALFSSGGPSHTGTLRNIKLKRGGQIIAAFDLYDVLLRGDTSYDTSLRDGDVIYIPPVGPQVAVLGDVKKPAIYELRAKASVAELVLWAGGFKSSADLTNVIVQKNTKSRYLTIAELKADWSSIQLRLASIPIEPTDIIRVVAPSSVALEVKVEREFVRVDGEVKQNGVFELKSGETLRDLLTRIGGVSEDGYVYGTKLTRESVRREQQAKIDESIDRYEKDIETSAKQRLAATADQQGMDKVVQAELDAQRSLVKKLRAVKSEGRIILDIRSANVGIEALPELPLKDGDRVYIPRRPMTVDVIGAVYQQNTFIFKDDRSVSNYLALAGGVSPTGDRGEVYRICADGTVKSRRHKGGSDVSPGDAIVVPEKLSRGKSLTQSLKDWTTILYQFGLGAAGLNALK